MSKLIEKIVIKVSKNIKKKITIKFFNVSAQKYVPKYIEIS